MRLFALYEEIDNKQMNELSRMVTRILEYSLRDSIENMHAGDGEFSEDDMKDFNLTIRNPIYVYVIDTWAKNIKGFNRKDFHYYITNILTDFLIRVKNKKEFKKCIKQGVNNAFDFLTRITKEGGDMGRYLSRYTYDLYEPAEYIKRTKL